MMTRLKGFLGDVPVVFAGASHSELILSSVREGGFDRRRVIGSAPEALAAAAKAMVALEAGCSPSEVALSVLGAPPSDLIVPWSDASIRGYALERVLTQAQVRRVEARVARLWPPGPHALGAAATRVVEALVTSARRAPSVLALLGGEFGARDKVGVVSCSLAPDGIAEIRVPTLNTRERVQVESALGV
jgi:malate/lactate dehydrogenase